VKISDMPRNDVPIALLYCAERNWVIREEDAEMLLMLQDDSDVLQREWASRGLTVRGTADTL
jgi:hypothetical protein